MLLEKYEKSLNKMKVLMLLLLDSREAEPVRGKLSLQKQMFVLAKNLGIEDEALFEPHHYGPYSEVLDADLEQLTLMNLVQVDSNIRITDEGRRVAEEIKKRVEEEKLKLIDEVKEWLNDLNEEELMALVYFTFPEMATASRKLNEIIKKRTELAISLYSKGKVSLEKAAEIAGMNLLDFINLLKRRKVPIELSL
jgi:predicted HTH domain antitoxin